MSEWFNTAAFSQNAIGTFGNTGRNIIRRPAVFNFDVPLFKRFRLSERFLTEFRVKAFNALNHPNLDLIYNTGGNVETFTSPTFGQITHASDPRLIQLALKLRF